MHIELDRSHDPHRKSWIKSAHDSTTDFTLNNLPWCAARSAEGGPAQVGTRVGNQFIPVYPIAQANLLNGLDGITPELFIGETLSKSLLSLTPSQRTALRLRLFDLLEEGASTDQQTIIRSHMVSVDQLTFIRPINVGDYTDFYASVHHATNVGLMFRPNNPLLPNYKWIPVGYHGRASSVVVSETLVHRPEGQLTPIEEGQAPAFGPCKLLDYELEMGAVVGQGNELGQAISIEDAENHLFGLTLLNDWSARDIQKWEYQPLGPFLAKNFLTTISPYIITMEALAPFRVPAEVRPESDPQPLPHLYSEHQMSHGGVDVELKVWLSTAQMRAQNLAPMQLSESRFSAMYWTLAQMLTHHSSSGCNLQPGDLFGSGTVSGPNRNQRGCLLELTWDGSKETPLPTSSRTPIQLPTGEERKFLANGDEITLSGQCVASNGLRIGFGKCRGRIV